MEAVRFQQLFISISSMTMFNDTKRDSNFNSCYN